jgi:hypothetical protein
MTTINLVRQQARLTEQERSTFFGLLLRVLDGLGELHKKRVRRFFAWLLQLEPGEMATIDVVQPRSTPFHRFHMKLESTVFEAQERIQHFEQFRYWLKVGAGHVVWMAGAKGGVVPVPKSISYAQLPEPEFREYHEDCLTFLRSEHACKYLWPHLTQDQARQMMDATLEAFDA